MIRPLLTVSTGLILLGAHPGRSGACDLACFPGYAAPPAGLTLPANAPGLVYVPPQVPNPGPPETGFQLFGADGAAIDVTLTPLPGPELRAFLVKAPLAPGPYRVRAVRDCATEGAGEPSATTFTVGASAPLPTNLGTVAAGATRRARLTVPDDGVCVREIEAGQSPLTITPSEQLRPYLPVARFALHVDGQPWTQTAFGAGWSAADDPYTVCDADAHATVERRLAPGAHTGVLAVEIAGATSAPAPVTFAFNLACPAGTTGAGPAGAGGCSLGTHPDRTGWAAATQLGIAALLLRRRR